VKEKFSHFVWYFKGFIVDLVFPIMALEQLPQKEIMGENSRRYFFLWGKYNGEYEF
jgi:hypothetical protein